MILIFDLDGVIYRGESAVPGAIPTLHHLTAAGHRLFFLTNNSTRSRQDYADKIARMGYPAMADQIMTSAYATVLYLQRQGAAGKRVFIIGEYGLAEEMSAAGLVVVPAGQHAQSAAELHDWLAAAVRGWNAAPTPFEWGGRRAERRQRARDRQHRQGGSGACTRHPLPRRPRIPSGFKGIVHAN